ncbi:ATP-binding cassette domain-containing protein [Streptomyces sp. NPDC021080]|uniref:ATP-binding cassette domain-containing protein n=1 Tax=Streptomyces sp. NPDC021080 TaxID=3365110 RepID=UPI0037A548A2
MTIDAGITGLLGPNGAGKTTLFRVLSTSVPPDSGELELFGAKITSERAARLARRDIGYLPQDFGYYPSFSVSEFVRYCAWLRGVSERDAGQATKTAVQMVGLESRAGHKMKSLSGGMLRRAGIAAAIVGSPRLILLDEPTVGLDPAQRLEFRNLLRGLSERGAAIVLSTHLVEDVSVACDAVLVFREGRVSYRGTPARLAAEAAAGAPGDTPIERGYMSVLTKGAEVDAAC